MATALGIGGTLVGVIIGAVLTRWIDFTYQRRKEIRDAIEASLILREELRDTKVGLNVLVELKKSSGELKFDGIDVWDSYRGRLLPSGMTHREWAQLNALFRHLFEIRPAVLEEPGDLSERTMRMLERARDDCAEAIETLDRFAVEGDIPLLMPKRIFERETSRRPDGRRSYP